MGGRERAVDHADVDRHPAGRSPSYTHVVPFNDLEVLGALLDERGDEIACLILEPVMMNIGICQPRARLPPGPRRTCCTSTARC